MALRNIITDEDETLHKISKQVTNFDAKLHALIDDMWDTMYAHNGAGLAAVQVGILRRIVVIDTGEAKYELINPEIIESKGSEKTVEGCLSIPERSCIMERPAWVKVKAQNRDGKPFTVSAEGFLRQAFCHEIDHLNGIILTDTMLGYYNGEEE